MNLIIIFIPSKIKEKYVSNIVYTNFRPYILESIRIYLWATSSSVSKMILCNSFFFRKKLLGGQPGSTERNLKSFLLPFLRGL